MSTIKIFMEEAKTIDIEVPLYRLSEENVEQITVTIKKLSEKLPVFSLILNGRTVLSTASMFSDIFNLVLREKNCYIVINKGV